MLGLLMLAIGLALGLTIGFFWFWNQGWIAGKNQGYKWGFQDGKQKVLYKIKKDGNVIVSNSEFIYKNNIISIVADILGQCSGDEIIISKLDLERLTIFYDKLSE
jgi:hypothetical protein